MNIYSKKFILTIVGLTVVFAIGAGAYFAYDKKNKDKQGIKQEFWQNVDMGNVLFLKGDFNQSIINLEKALSLNLGDANKNNAKINLANSYFYKNKDGDNRIKAVLILKQIVKDLNATNNNKANALRTLGDFYYRDVDANFAKQYIFDGDKFAEILKNSNGNAELAIKKIYEWSNEFNPRAIVYYRLGAWHCCSALLSIEGKNPRLSAETVKEYITIVKEMLRQGDKYFANEMSNDILSKAQQGTAYHLRARALAGLYTYSMGPTKEEIEENYQKAINLYETGDNYISKMHSILTVRFHYAAFIVEFEGKNAVNKIKSIIEPVISGFNNSEIKKADFYNFLKNINEPENNFHYRRRRALLIAKYVPEFRDLLKQLGWTEEQLNIKITPLYEK